MTCAKNVIILNMIISATALGTEKYESPRDQAVYLSAGFFVHISFSTGHLQTHKCRVQTERKLLLGHRNGKRRRLILTVFDHLRTPKRHYCQFKWMRLLLIIPFPLVLTRPLKMPVCVMESFGKSVTLTHRLNSSHRELLKPRTPGRATALPACVFACAYMRVSISPDNNKGRRFKRVAFLQFIK